MRVTDASRQRLNAMTGPISAYQDALQRMRNAVAQTQVARRTMISEGNTVLKLINDLRDRIGALDTGNPQRSSLQAGFTAFNDEMLMTRYEVRGS